MIYEDPARMKCREGLAVLLDRATARNDRGILDCWNVMFIRRMNCNPGSMRGETVCRWVSRRSKVRA
jgi:hypothetical protein